MRVIILECYSAFFATILERTVFKCLSVKCLECFFYD